MARHTPIIVVLSVLVLGAGAVGWRATRDGGAQAVPEARAEAAVAVEVAGVGSGMIRDIRTLNGTLEASARFTITAEASGRVERVLVDIGDRVRRGSLVAQLEDSELRQAVAQADAELAVRAAELNRAESDFGLAEREFERTRTLFDDGVAAQTELEQADAELAAARAQVQLAEARREQAEAARGLAKVRLGFATVTAEWDRDETAVEEVTVADRFVDPGDTVQVGADLVEMVSLDPLLVAVNVTERDYPALEVGQGALLTADALPEDVFDAKVVRISPVFRETSRQARIELEVENAGVVLRPGMFGRVRITLREREAEAIVPLAALTQRAGRTGLFEVSEDGSEVSLRFVRLGIVEGERAEVFADDGGELITGRVVTLGQQLLDDGSKVNVVGDSVAAMLGLPGRTDGAIAPVAGNRAVPDAPVAGGGSGVGTGAGSEVGSGVAKASAASPMDGRVTEGGAESGGDRAKVQPGALQ